MNETELLARVSGSAGVRRLEISIEIEAPILEVWAAISTAELMARWWTGGKVEAEENGQLVLEDGSAVNGRVKVCYPPHIFEFSWNENPGQATHPQLIDPATKSLVRFDLVELRESRTRLSFIQFLPAAEIIGAAAGWHQIIGERLKGLLETGSVPEHEARFEELQAAYADAGFG